jgi:hemoglobin
MNTEKDMIEVVVRAFYEKARTDILIGYHFQRIPDFETHLPRIFAFWELQLLGKTDHALGEPLDVIRAHVPLHIHTGEVNRWVKLFLETLSESDASEELKARWPSKLAHFQQIFLNSSLLFPSGAGRG